MVRLHAGASLAVVLCSWCMLQSVLASTLEYSGSNPTDAYDFSGSDGVNTDAGSGFGSTAAGAVAPGSGQGTDVDDEDNVFPKLPDIPSDDEDDIPDGGSANDVDIDGDNFETSIWRSTSPSATTSRTSTTTSSTTASTSTTSTTSKSTTVKVWERTSDIDVDDSDDAEDKMSGSGVEEKTEPPITRPHGPCELKQAERLEKKKDFHHKCTEDGYFDQILCIEKCKCVDRETGKRNRNLVYDEDREQCVANEPRVDIPKPGDPSYDLDGDKDQQNDDKDDDEDDDKDDDLPRKKGGNGNLLTENPVLFAGIIGGAVVGLLVLILLVMFVVYRMRKKDEGSYALDAQKKPAAHPYQRCPQEYYA